MPNFGLINEDNIVVNVIIADREFIQSGQVGDPSKWIEDTEDVYNEPGIGRTYDPVNKAFIDPKPYTSWVLDSNFLWQPPVPKPVEDGIWRWNEDNVSWDKVS